MKKLWILLLLAAWAIPSQAASFTPAQLAEQAVQQALQNTRKLFTVHPNSLSSLPKEQFQAIATAVALVKQAKPSASALDFTQIPQQAFPETLSVQIIFDTRANIVAQLQKTHIPAQTLKNANGLTITQKTPAGKYIHTVFIPTDDFTSNPDTAYLTARIAIVLAHEIYGHVYHYLQNPKTAFSSETAKELRAYKQSTAFARAIIQSQLFQTFPKQLQEQFQAALTKEEALLRSYNVQK